MLICSEYTSVHAPLYRLQHDWTWRVCQASSQQLAHLESCPTQYLLLYFRLEQNRRPWCQHLSRAQWHHLKDKDLENNLIVGWLGWWKWCLMILDIILFHHRIKTLFWISNRSVFSPLHQLSWSALASQFGFRLLATIVLRNKVR